MTTQNEILSQTLSGYELDKGTIACPLDDYLVQGTEIGAIIDDEPTFQVISHIRSPYHVAGRQLCHQNRESATLQIFNGQSGTWAIVKSFQRLPTPEASTITLLAAQEQCKSTEPCIFVKNSGEYKTVERLVKAAGGN